MLLLYKRADKICRNVFVKTFVIKYVKFIISYKLKIDFQRDIKRVAKKQFIDQNTDVVIV